jgi:hypothetical protein
MKRKIPIGLLFPKEAMTEINGKKGWLNKNGDFFPEETVKTMVSGIPVTKGCGGCSFMDLVKENESCPNVRKCILIPPLHEMFSYYHPKNKRKTV